MKVITTYGPDLANITSEAGPEGANLNDLMSKLTGGGGNQSSMGGDQY